MFISLETIVFDLLLVNEQNSYSSLELTPLQHQFHSLMHILAWETDQCSSPMYSVLKKNLPCWTAIQTKSQLPPLVPMPKTLVCNAWVSLSCETHCTCTCGWFSSSVI